MERPTTATGSRAFPKPMSRVEQKWNLRFKKCRWSANQSALSHRRVLPPIQHAQTQTAVQLMPTVWDTLQGLQTLTDTHRHWTKADHCVRVLRQTDCSFLTKLGSAELASNRYLVIQGWLLPGQWQCQHWTFRAVYIYILYYYTVCKKDEYICVYIYIYMYLWNRTLHLSSPSPAAVERTTSSTPQRHSIVLPIPRWHHAESWYFVSLPMVYSKSEQFHQSEGKAGMGYLWLDYTCVFQILDSSWCMSCSDNNLSGRWPILTCSTVWVSVVQQV